MEQKKNSGLRVLFTVIGILASIGALAFVAYKIFKKYFKVSFECDGDCDCCDDKCDDALKDRSEVALDFEDAEEKDVIPEIVDEEEKTEE